MKLTSLYLSLTEGRQDNLFLLPLQTLPVQWLHRPLLSLLCCVQHRCGLKRSWASVSTGFPPFLRIFCKPVVEPQSFLLGPYKQERTCPPASEDALLAGDSCFGVNPALLTRQSTFGRLPSGVTRAVAGRGDAQRCLLCWQTLIRLTSLMQSKPARGAFRVCVLGMGARRLPPHL